MNGRVLKSFVLKLLRLQDLISSGITCQIWELAYLPTFLSSQKSQTWTSWASMEGTTPLHVPWSHTTIRFSRTMALYSILISISTAPSWKSCLKRERIALRTIILTNLSSSSNNNNSNSSITTINSIIRISELSPQELLSTLQEVESPTITKIPPTVTTLIT